MDDEFSRLQIKMPKDVTLWLIKAAERDCRHPREQALWYLLQAKQDEEAVAGTNPA